MKDKLIEDGRLKEILKRRKVSISSQDNEELIEAASHNLPWNEELAKLCSQVLKSGKSKAGKDISPPIKKKQHEDEQPFTSNVFLLTSSCTNVAILIQSVCHREVRKLFILILMWKTIILIVLKNLAIWISACLILILTIPIAIALQEKQKRWRMLSV